MHRCYKSDYMNVNKTESGSCSISNVQMLRRDKQSQRSAGIMFVYHKICLFTVSVTPTEGFENLHYVKKNVHL